MQEKAVECVLPYFLIPRLNYYILKVFWIFFQKPTQATPLSGGQATPLSGGHNRSNTGQENEM